MANDTFRARDADHDRAVEIETNEFRHHGWVSFPFGTETDKGLTKALAGQSDSTSRMLRFRPDRVHVKVGYRSLLCEVKSEHQGSPYFAVEMDSYGAAQVWNETTDRMMMTLVDLKTEVIRCAWMDDLSPPKEILVPDRSGFEERRERMAGEWPTAIVKVIRWRGGSGTPFMLVAKITLRPLGTFILQELSGDVPAPPPTPANQFMPIEFGVASQLKLWEAGSP